MNPAIDISNTILHTERMILRPWAEHDLNDLFDYAKVDGVGQMAGWKPHANIGESKVILDLFTKGKKTFAIEYQGKVVGSIGIEEYNENHFPEFDKLKGREIGYVLSKDVWGKGLMPEAVKEVIRFLFEEIGLDVIFCGHFLWNSQSQRVQEKCGFRHYAYDLFRTSLGKDEENEVTILTYDEWKAGNEKEETRKCSDFISDGILAYGIAVGRFLFEEERRIVYAVSDYPHVGNSDVFMYYQISRMDYDRLLKMSLTQQIPDPPVQKETIEACHKSFLCGESAYSKRNAFSLKDTDLSLTETYGGI